MLAELPIVASDIPAIRELFSTHDTSFLYKPADDSDLVVKLKELILDESLRKQTGKQNRTYVLKNHHPDVLIPYINQITADR